MALKAWFCGVISFKAGTEVFACQRPPDGIGLNFKHGYNVEHDNELIDEYNPVSVAGARWLKQSNENTTFGGIEMLILMHMHMLPKETCEFHMTQA